MKGLYLSGLPDWRGADPSVSIEYRTWYVDHMDSDGPGWIRLARAPD